MVKLDHKPLTEFIFPQMKAFTLINKHEDTPLLYNKTRNKIFSLREATVNAFIVLAILISKTVRQRFEIIMYIVSNIDRTTSLTNCVEVYTLLLTSLYIYIYMYCGIYTWVIGTGKVCTGLVAIINLLTISSCCT